jgi:hypothetical protein
MGRGYMVEEAVERYLSSLCSSSPLTGLLLGQVPLLPLLLPLLLQPSDRPAPRTGPLLPVLEL